MPRVPLEKLHVNGMPHIFLVVRSTNRNKEHDEGIFKKHTFNFTFNVNFTGNKFINVSS